MAENEDPGDDLSEAQIAKIIHDWKNKEAPRRMLRSVTEEVICEYAGVPFDPIGGSHKAIMQLRWAAVVRMMGEQAAADAKIVRDKAARAERQEFVVKAAWEKVTSIVTGMIVLLGLGWIAAKLGIKLPGAG